MGIDSESNSTKTFCPRLPLQIIEILNLNCRGKKTVEMQTQIEREHKNRSLDVIKMSNRSRVTGQGLFTSGSIIHFLSSPKGGLCPISRRKWNFFPDYLFSSLSLPGLCECLE